MTRIIRYFTPFIPPRVVVTVKKCNPMISPYSTIRSFTSHPEGPATQDRLHRVEKGGGHCVPTMNPPPRPSPEGREYELNSGDLRSPGPRPGASPLDPKRNILFRGPAVPEPQTVILRGVQRSRRIQKIYT